MCANWRATSPCLRNTFWSHEEEGGGNAAPSFQPRRVCALTRSEVGRRLEELTGAGRSAVSEVFNKRFEDVYAKVGGGTLWYLKP